MDKWVAAALRIGGALLIAGISLLPAYAGAWAACHDGSAWCGTTPDLKAAYGYLGVAGALLGLAVAVGIGAHWRRIAFLMLGGAAVGLAAAALLMI